jgi:transcriptional regulator with XRE-family HTH domain
MSECIEARTERWTFDSRRLARRLSEARRRLGWSTRELACRSGLSQPYIVALERARSKDAGAGPTPTVDAVARLAGALGMEAVALFAAALRPIGRHVFMVVPRSSPRTLLAAQHASGADEMAWMTVGSPHGSAPAGGAAHYAIDLRRTVDGTYHPDTVADSLTDQLRDLDGSISGSEVGLIFTDTSKLMTSLDDPDTITRFEHRWASVVDAAAAAAHAHAAWNVCVYEIGALRSLADPVATTLDLMRSHDITWSERHGRMTTGVEASQHVLERLRPAGTKPAEWRVIARELATGVRQAA